AAFVTARYGDALRIESPKQEDLTDVQHDYLLGYLNDFEDALALGDGSYTTFIDVDSFVDHLLMMELSRNVDAYVLSTYMHKPRDGKLFMGPVWDFNGSLGNADYFDAWQVEGWHYNNPEFPADNPNGFRWYEKLLEDTAFQGRISERWAEHRAGAWSDTQLLADIDTTEASLEMSAARNFERWPVLGEYVWPNDEGAEDRTTYAEEVSYLGDWVTRRAAWMDSRLDGSRQ
ncbi:MAG: hypothetical protein ACJAV2_004581, partial [Myxococcota bacterium]